MPRYKLTIEYDGTDFCGWQKQKSGLSVQEVLEKALFAFTHIESEVYGAGRTDAGVHAYGQVAHFDLPTARDPFEMQASFNALVRPHAVGVLKVETVCDDFHARFSAKERSYIYKILNRRTPAVLDKNPNSLKVIAKYAPDEFKQAVLMQDEQGYTPVHLADKNKEILEIIAKQAPKEFKQTVSTKDNYGWTPVDYVTRVADFDTPNADDYQIDLNNNSIIKIEE